MAYDTNQSKVTQEEFEYSREMIGKLANYFENVVVGQKNLETSLLTAILADGHVLIESVPGLAKTTAAKTVHTGSSSRRHNRNTGLQQTDFTVRYRTRPRICQLCSSR